MRALDHLVFATLDLDLSVADLEGRLGVRAVPGGRHEGRGTRNSLLALTHDAYLEIIAPDPDQPRPRAPRAFGLDDLEAPRLVTWAARSADLEADVRNARVHHLDLGEIEAGGRRRPDGVALRWRYAGVRASRLGGIVPFLIDWLDSPHPSRDALAGATLVALRAEHPEPEPVRSALAALGIELPVARGAAPGLIATLRGPRGEIELR